MALRIHKASAGILIAAQAGAARVSRMHAAAIYEPVGGASLYRITSFVVTGTAPPPVGVAFTYKTTT